jgi:hypothetical protein
LIKLRKLWEEVFWNMAEGDATRYQVLKGTEEIEFFNLFELHKKRIEKEINANRNHGK